MANVLLKKRLCDELGWCCPYMFINMQEIKRIYGASEELARMQSGTVLANRTGVCRRTIFNLRKALREGTLVCPGKDTPKCLERHQVAAMKPWTIEGPKRRAARESSPKSETEPQGGEGPLLPSES